MNKFPVLSAKLTPNIRYIVFSDGSTVNGAVNGGMSVPDTSDGYWTGALKSLSGTKDSVWAWEWGGTCHMWVPFNKKTCIDSYTLLCDWNLPIEKQPATYKRTFKGQASVDLDWD